MEYAYLAASCFFFSIQFVFHKLFQKYSDSSFAAGIWCSLVNALVMTVFLLPKVGLDLEISTSSVICSAVFAVSTLMLTVMTMIALKAGKISAVTTFTLLGGLLLPFIWGVAVYKEPMTLLKGLGLLLMFLCMTAGLLSDGKRTEDGSRKKNSRPTVYLFACLMLFVLNGAISIVTAVSQKAPDAVSSDSFLMLSLIETAVLSFLMLIIYGIVLSKRGDKNGMKKVFYEIAAEPPMTGKVYLLLIVFCALHSVCNGVGNLFSLTCAQTMDSSIQFPVLSAVVIVLGALVGLVCFREKISKRDAVGLLLACAGIVCFVLK